MVKAEAYHDEDKVAARHVKPFAMIVRRPTTACDVTATLSAAYQMVDTRSL